MLECKDRGEIVQILKAPIYKVPIYESTKILGFQALGKANLPGTLGRRCLDLVPTFRAGCFFKSTVPAFSSFWTIRFLSVRMALANLCVVSPSACPPSASCCLVPGCFLQRTCTSPLFGICRERSKKLIACEHWSCRKLGNQDWGRGMPCTGVPRPLGPKSPKVSKRSSRAFRPRVSKSVAKSPRTRQRVKNVSNQRSGTGLFRHSGPEGPGRLFETFWGFGGSGIWRTPACICREQKRHIKL